MLWVPWNCWQSSRPDGLVTTMLLKPKKVIMVMWWWCLYKPVTASRQTEHFSLVVKLRAYGTEGAEF
ncbi:hypothetical protein TNCV_2047861 [Trichonephila clavipes]|nr:hypothetical protein TNCV_2047861 [Trichonephila clavipes]